MIRDKAIQSIMDDGLRSKLFRTDNLTLETLLSTCSDWQDHRALMLGSKLQSSSVNMVSTVTCYRRNAAGHIGRDCRRSREHICAKCNKKGHFEVCCRRKLEGVSRGRGFKGPSTSQNTVPARGKGRSQSHLRGGKLARGKGRKTYYVGESDENKQQTETDSEQNQVSKSFYVFSLNPDNVNSDIELVVVENGKKKCSNNRFWF